MLIWFGHPCLVQLVNNWSVPDMVHFCQRYSFVIRTVRVSSFNLIILNQSEDLKLFASNSGAQGINLKLFLVNERT